MQFSVPITYLSPLFQMAAICKKSESVDDCQMSFLACFSSIDLALRTVGGAM